MEILSYPLFCSVLSFIIKKEKNFAHYSKDNLCYGNNKPLEWNMDNVVNYNK